MDWQVDIDGQWMDKKKQGVDGIVDIEGNTIYYEGDCVPLMPQGGPLFAIALDDGAFLQAKLEEDSLVWQDGDVWVLMSHRVSQAAGASAAEVSRANQESLRLQADAAANAARSAAALAGLSVEVQADQATKAAVLAAAAGAQVSGETDYAEVAKKVATEKKRHSVENCIVPDHGKVVEVFRKFDQDGNGKVSSDELRTSLQFVDKAVFTDDRCKKVFKHLDADNSGALDIAELCAWIYSDQKNTLQKAVMSDCVEVPTYLDGTWIHKNRVQFEEIIRDGQVITKDAAIPIRTLKHRDIFIQPGDADTILRGSVKGNSLVWEDGDVWVRCDADTAAAAAEAARKAAADSGLSKQHQAKHAEKAAISATARAAQAAGFDSRAIAKKVASAKRQYGDPDARIADHAKVDEFLKAADFDGNGKISALEMHAMLQGIGDFNDEACGKVFQFLDRDKNGSVDVAELCTWVYAEDDSWLSWAVLGAVVRPSDAPRRSRKASSKKG